MRVDSILTDPLLTIDYRHSPDSSTDDDSGGGLFGVNAELIFRAASARVHRIVIDDPVGAVGAYTLSIEPMTVPDSDQGLGMRRTVPPAPPPIGEALTCSSPPARGSR